MCQINVIPSNPVAFYFELGSLVANNHTADCSRFQGILNNLCKVSRCHPAHKQAQFSVCWTFLRRRLIINSWQIYIIYVIFIIKFLLKDYVIDIHTWNIAYGKILTVCCDCGDYLMNLIGKIWQSVEKLNFTMMICLEWVPWNIWLLCLLIPAVDTWNIAYGKILTVCCDCGDYLMNLIGKIWQSVEKLNFTMTHPPNPMVSLLHNDCTFGTLEITMFCLTMATCSFLVCGKPGMPA